MSRFGALDTPGYTERAMAISRGQILVSNLIVAEKIGTVLVSTVVA